MAFDSSILGQVAAKCMENMESDEELHGGSLDAVLIVVVASTADNSHSVTRTFSSESEIWKQVGLSEMGKRCINYGENAEDD